MPPSVPEPPDDSARADIDFQSGYRTSRGKVPQAGDLQYSSVRDARTPLHSGVTDDVVNAKEEHRGRSSRTRRLVPSSSFYSVSGRFRLALVR